MAGVAILCCVKPACLMCDRAGDAACMTCCRLVCWACAGNHCASCSAAAGQCAPSLPERTAADYEDSPRSTSASGREEVHSATTSEVEEFFVRLDALWSSAGFGELEPDFNGRLHRLPLMSRCTVYEPASGTWRCWGDLASLQYLATSLEWELPSGIVVFHGGARSCVLFRSAADAEPLEPRDALRLLVERAGACLCLVVNTTESLFEVAHLELERAIGDRRQQARQRGLLDKLLRALIGRFDVAFWRTE